ncbi:MAG: Arm DNA-binding domain-containing protein [Vicinamibacterales bacterium]
MPTITLNDRAIAALKPSVDRVDYFDRSLPGFGIRVSTAGRKTFILLHRINGRLQRLTLKDPETDISTYPTLTLARARELARQALRASTLGEDPAETRKLTRERTFGVLADLYLDQHAKRKKRTWRADARMIRLELKAWRDLPVNALRRSDVRDVLEGIVDRGAPGTRQPRVGVGTEDPQFRGRSRVGRRQRRRKDGAPVGRGLARSRADRGRNPCGVDVARPRPADRERRR